MASSKRRILQQPPEVVARWVKLRLRSYIPVASRAYARLKFDRKAENKRLRQLEDTFGEVKRVLFELDGTQFTASKAIYNAAFFFLLIEIDVGSIRWDAMTHPNDRLRSFLTRALLLTLHEFDLSKVAGREFKAAMITVGVEDNIQKQVDGALRKVRHAHARVKKELSSFRNATVAHRDRDALAQYRAIRDLDHILVFDIGSQFYEAASEFIAILPSLMLSANSWSAFCRQFDGSSDTPTAT